MIPLRVAAALLLAATSLAAQSPGPADEARAAWRYRRDVAVPEGREGGFVVIPLPPDVATRAQANLIDLRLVAADGREVAFLVREDQPRQEERRVAGALTEARRERREISSWTADFGRAIAFDRLELAIEARDFSKRMAVETSIDGTTWLRLGDDVWVFDRPWQGRQVRGTAIDVATATARFVRVTTDDARSAPVTLTGLTAVASRRFSGSRWSRPAELILDRRADGRSRYRVAVPDGFPLGRLEIDADDPVFARPVRLLVQDDGDRQVGGSTVYRLPLPETDASVETRGVEVNQPFRGGLIVEVEDGDSPPLRNPRVVLSGPQTELIAAPATAAAALYYGNPVARRMVYDLERLRSALSVAEGLPATTLGEEVENPRFRAPVPLTFLPSRGAELAAGDWTFVRPFRVEGNEDLYSLTLSPEDLSRGRADLADLRVVDAAGRQVPYIVERDAETVSVPLPTAPEAPRGGRAANSAFSLSLASAGGAERLAVSAIELQIVEGYFQRRATVLQRDPAAPQGLRVVGGATIGASSRDGESTGAVVRIPLGRVTAPDLVVEIENGDNAPLTVRSAAGIATVPRLTFKAGPGEYRLLLGNATADAPSYEIDALRRDVLDYSAVPVPAGWLAATAPNPDRERSVADVVRETPPTVILWSALGVAIVVLLLLTRRILGAPVDPPR